MTAQNVVCVKYKVDLDLIIICMNRFTLKSMSVLCANSSALFALILWLTAILLMLIVVRQQTFDSQLMLSIKVFNDIYFLL